MNFKNIIATSIYLVIIGLLIIKSNFDNLIIKDIALITSSYATLIIAISLYDRFNYRKIIFEKKLDIVLKLLETIKATQITLFYRNQGKEVRDIRNISIEKNIDFKSLKREISIEANILFQSEELFYFKEMAIFRGSPYMPIEIVKSLEFLKVDQFIGVKSEELYQKEHIKLAIKKPIANTLDLDNWNKPGKDMPIEHFLKDYIACLNTIENWINKHSNIKSQLNL